MAPLKTVAPLLFLLGKLADAGPSLIETFQVGKSGGVLSWFSHYIAAADSGSVKVIDDFTGNVAYQLDVPNGATIQSMQFSPDGSHLVTSTDSSVYVWSVAGKNITLTIPAASGAKWSPDGKRLAGASGTDTVKIWDATTGAEQLKAQVVATTWGTPQVAWSPDGQRLATASGNKEWRPFALEVWEVSSGNKVYSSASGYVSLVYGVEWSPAGDLIAVPGYELCTAMGGPCWPYLTQTFDASNGQLLNTIANASVPVALSKDGNSLAGVFTTLAYSATAAGVWDAHTGVQTEALDSQNNVQALTWSPDNHLLALSTQTSSASPNTTSAIELWSLQCLKGRVKPVSLQI